MRSFCFGLFSLSPIGMRTTRWIRAINPFLHLLRMPNLSVLNAGCAAAYKVKPEYMLIVGFGMALLQQTITPAASKSFGLCSIIVHFFVPSSKADRSGFIRVYLSPTFDIMQIS